MNRLFTTGNQSGSLKFRNLLVVIKQTAYEEYSQLKLRGQAPKALRWKRLESRYKAHKQCVNDLLSILRKHNVSFSCVNRVELDRQHLSDIDLMIAVGGDGTVLSAAHFLDHGTIPLLGINSDPTTSQEDRSVKNKKSDERRSHGALCMCTSSDMEDGINSVLEGTARLSERTRIHCVVKSTFSETRLVPALNDLLIANPSPAAVSRYRMGWLKPVEVPNIVERGSSLAENKLLPKSSTYGTITRFGGLPYDITNSINVWSSGMWISTATGSTAAMTAAGGKQMLPDSTELQYLIREHMIEGDISHLSSEEKKRINNGFFCNRREKENASNENINDNDNDDYSNKTLHLRWNSQKGRIFIDGSHLTHNLELGDEIIIDNKAPPLCIFTRNND